MKHIFVFVQNRREFYFGSRENNDSKTRRHFYESTKQVTYFQDKYFKKNIFIVYFILSLSPLRCNIQNIFI